MNRYTITNLRNNQEHNVVADVMPDRTNQPLWGAPAGVKRKDRCDSWELANGVTAGLDLEGRELWSFSDSMSVVVVNIDADIAAESDKKQKVKTALDDIIAFDPDAATPNQVKKFHKDLIRVLKFLVRNA